MQAGATPLHLDAVFQRSRKETCVIETAGRCGRCGVDVIGNHPRLPTGSGKFCFTPAHANAGTKTSSFEAPLLFLAPFLALCLAPVPSSSRGIVAVVLRVHSFSRLCRSVITSGPSLHFSEVSMASAGRVSQRYEIGYAPVGR